MRNVAGIRLFPMRELDDGLKSVWLRTSKAISGVPFGGKYQFEDRIANHSQSLVALRDMATVDDEHGRPGGL